MKSKRLVDHPSNGIRGNPIVAALTCLLTLMIAISCGGKGGSDDDDDCDIDEQKREVLSIMEEAYFYNDEVDQASKYSGLNFKRFLTPNQLLDFLRYLPDEFDRFFSYITTPEAEEEFFDKGQFVGFGVLLGASTPGEIDILDVFEDSPALTAGLVRGDVILEIDGRTIDEIEAEEGINQALGPPVEGVTRTFLIRDQLNAETQVEVIKDAVAVNPVPLYDIFDVNGKTVGYLDFRTFINPAIADLDMAFTAFGNAGVDNLVVDLRYNGGGLLSIAATLNDILGGIGHLGQVQFQVLYNQLLSEFDEIVLFEPHPLAIALNRIAFITTDFTASASELLINSLDPYYDVFVVGSDTFGKPVGQVGASYCDNEFILRAVAFEIVNVDGFGDYNTGLAADCPAVDDLTREIGDPAEASLAEALAVIDSGLCTPPPPMPLTAQASRIRADTPAIQGSTPASRLMNAY
jgi:carboxyl-terminal processing protease